MTYEEQIINDTKCISFVDMKKIAQEREKWRDAAH